MRTLIINSYAGSITQGASELGCDIIGSYEDKNFFLEVQKANFPHLNFIAYEHQWPKQDLSETVVIAHPPCSAFSVQNCSPTARGVNSDAFGCTKKVLDYAMDNRALAIAVESVMGALPGAWNVHQQYADDHGYHLYRIVENGIMWGCQWRERFWAVWIRKGAAHDVWAINLTPNYQTVKEVVTGWEDGPSAGNQDVLLERQKTRLIEDAKCTPEEMDYFFKPQVPAHRTAALGTILWEKKFKQPDSLPEEKWDMFTDYIGGFASRTMVYLDPDGYSPVVMGGSFWYYNGRCVSENAFKRIMGFPGNYIFPSKPQTSKDYRKDMRTGLSKGVMPPIAKWVLEELGKHLGMLGRDHVTQSAAQSYLIPCAPNKIADFRIRKKDWWMRHEAFPPLKSVIDEEVIRERQERRNRRVVAISTPRTERLPRVDGDVAIVGMPTDLKRQVIAELIKSNQWTLDQAVEECRKHLSLNVLPTTMRWHIKQMVRAGQVSFAS